MSGCFGWYCCAQGKLMSGPHRDRRRRVELIVRHDQIPRRRSFADARRGIVLRAVAGAEIAAELAARLAFLVAQRHTAEMGADADHDQPVLMPLFGPLLE